MTTAAPSHPVAHDGAALAELYRDLHRHPELSYQETRTAAIVAQALASWGYQTTTDVGRTGVVGLLPNGAGPTVLLRADMDALPVEEKTGLDYASVARGVDHEGLDVPVMHACGHDMHVTCLLGAAARLAADRAPWSGTLMVVFQPAEELGSGARAMLDDGLYERFDRPDVVLGQHVAPLPAGMVGLHPGPAFAAYDAVRVTLHGRGGHGSRPETCVDPVLMAAAVVLRLQGIVSREIGGSETAVVTVGTLRAGTKVNIIPDTAELQISVRTFDPRVRERVMAAIDRIVHAEAQASGAPRPPDIELLESFPLVSNDPDACARTSAGLAAAIGADRVLDPGSVTGSEDVGMLATDAGVPCVYWLLGGADPAAFAGAADVEALSRVVASLPSNHSPLFAPLIEPTITVGVAALVASARTWLADPA
jgi:hippurate hydrolase